jgi:ABC transport system ATP-binding/permease protein
VALFNSDPNLVVMSAAGQTREISIPVNGIVLGRDSQLGPPFSTDEFLSRNHASVQRRGDGVEVADLGSANGTYLNGARVHAPAPVREGDVLRIGRIELTLAMPVRVPEGAPNLMVVAPNAFSGRQIRLPGDYMVVGRDPASDICLDDPYVSWTHAAFERRPDAVYVEDLGSTSGTFVNGQAVTACRQLHPGDIVAFAGVTARFD